MTRDVSLFTRIKNYRARHRRARNFSIPFTFARNFSLPKQIQIDDHPINLNLQYNRATTADFIGIFLNDNYFLEFIKNCDAILDVGANQGLFSLYARALFPKAVIHAYEPNPEALVYLEKNVKPLGVRIFSEAVGLSDGLCDINTNDFLSHASVRRNESGQIRMSAFKEVVQRLPQKKAILLKLDCEGSEWEILADPNLRTEISFLTMEYHKWAKPKGAKDVVHLLNETDFEVVAHSEAQSTGQILAFNRRMVDLEAIDG